MYRYCKVGFLKNRVAAKSMKSKLIISIVAIAALMSIQPALALEVGNKAPNCALTVISDGQKYDLNQFQGKVLYIDFWASWCVPCAKSFPFFNQLHADLAGQGLHILAANLDENSSDAQDFLAKTPVNFMVAADSNKQCANEFAVTAMPSSYLIDRKGIVRHIHLGFRPGEAEELRSLLITLLAEK
jgi:thiol-disulfide isomerase/thioredoxin